METLNRFQPYVFSILRIMVGLLFMQHGLSKLFGFPVGAGFPAFLSLTWFEGCIEMIGGGLIVIGLFTRWAAFITSGEMAIGYFIVHAPKGFFPYSRSFIASYSSTLCSPAQAQSALTRYWRKRRGGRHHPSLSQRTFPPPWGLFLLGHASQPDKTGQGLSRNAPSKPPFENKDSG